MLLNIFFDNMNSSLELILIGIVLFAVYWFIMRKYNSLGLRLFILCIFLFIGSCVWLYKDEAVLKNTLANGEQHIANIISKATVGKNDHQVEVSFTANDGSPVTSKSTQYISQEEWNAFTAGSALPVIYLSSSGKTYVQQSLQRFRADKIYLYYFSAFWLLLGVGLLIWLRKYKVGVDDEGNEWVVKEDGSIILDERKSAFAQMSKRANIVSKLAQSFGK
ncbi:MAG: hypothetical protein ABJA78_20515 [Ferruginibacter sp.]